MLLVVGSCGDSGIPTSSPSAGRGAGVVVRVIDGDTIEVELLGTKERVRLIGVDSPEKTGGLRDPECFGDEATAFMSSLLPMGSPVLLERDVEARDDYDRLLAYVHADGLFVNLHLIEQGLAVDFPYPPNTTYAEEFSEAADIAARKGMGLWSHCGSADRPLG